MFLLVLDKSPYKAAELVPDRLKFKQLLELGQLICSAEISNVYKKINQGKELQKWVRNNRAWTYWFAMFLYDYCLNNLNLKAETIMKIKEIIRDLHNSTDITKENEYPKNAIFRYVKEYAEFTEYETNSELPIDVAIQEYKRYLEYKEKQYANRIRSKKGII